MSAKANYFKIGVFVIAATVIIIAGIVVLGAGELFRPEVLVETYFDDSVQGLDIGSPVKFRGVQIGRINFIGLAAREYSTQRRYILIRISIFPDALWLREKSIMTSLMAEEIEKGLRVRLTPQGVTGTAYLEADYLDPRRFKPLAFEWQPHYPYIPSAPSTITRFSESLDRIMRNLEQINVLGIATGIEETLTAIRKTLDDANLQGIGEEAEQFLAELRRTNIQLEHLIDTEITPALATFHRITDKSEEPLGQAVESIRETSQGIHELSRDLRAFSGGLPDVTDQLRTTLRRLDDLLYTQQQNLEATTDNIRVISENLKELSQNSKKYPSQILFGAPPAPSKVGAQ